MKNNEIIKFFEGLGKLRESGKQFPAKVSFAVSRNGRKLAPIVEDFEKTRLEIIQANCNPSTEQQGVFYPKDEQAQEYVNQEISNLLNADNSDIKLNMIQFSDIEGLSLSIEEMDYLYPMIENGEE